MVIPSHVPGAASDYFVGLSVWDTNSTGGYYDQAGFYPLNTNGQTNGIAWGDEESVASNFPCSNFQVVWEQSQHRSFTPGDLVTVTIVIEPNNTIAFTFSDANGTTYAIDSGQQSLTGSFTSNGCGDATGGSGSPYSIYEEEQLTQNDVPQFNILWLNNEFAGNPVTSGWGDIVTGSPGGGNITAVGQDSGGENVVLYNLYDNVSVSAPTSTDSIALGFSQQQRSVDIQEGVEGGTCIGNGACGMLYSVGNVLNGGAPSGSQEFAKVPGQGDGFSSQSGLSITTGVLSYTYAPPTGSTGTIAYAWNRGSDNHIMVSYSPDFYCLTNSPSCPFSWYGPFDTGAQMYGFASAPAVAIAPNPQGSNNVLWVAYPDTSGTIQLMHSEDAGLTWHHVSASSGETTYGSIGISYIAKANDLLVSWVGTDGSVNFATYSISNNAWSGADTISASTPPNVAVTSFNTVINQNDVRENLTYPFSLATWQAEPNHQIILSLMDYRYIPSDGGAFVPGFSYQVEIPNTSVAGNAGNEVQNLASADNEGVLAYIPSSGTFLNLFTEF